MKRRDFLHQVSHAVAASTILPDLHFLDASKKYSLLNNTNEPGKILIVLRFDGGNDGLNTIVPMDQYANLNKVRSHIILPEKKLLNLSKNDLAFHPEFKDLKVLFEEKRMKIIQNVGYASPDLSHFRSSDIWQSASDFGEFVSSGWLGRLVEHEHPNFPEAYPNPQFPDPVAIELGYNNSLLLTGKKTFPGFISGNPESIKDILNEFDNSYPSSFVGEKLKYIQTIAKQSNLYSAVLKEAYLKGNHSIPFPDGDLGQQFYALSRFIRGGLNTRIYHAIFGGFDTHDFQVNPDDHTQGSHARLLKTINDCIISLMKVLDESGDSDRIMLVTFSEFGRRVVSRSTFGTDHGTAFPMMIFGNNLNANVLGKNPKIDPNMTWEDNLPSEFDFRQIYASIIEQWMDGNDLTLKDVLTKEYQQVGITKAYADDDYDGVLDKNDKCLNTPLGAMVDTNGCEVFSLAADALSVTSKAASCLGQKNGSVLINAINKNFNYTFSISGTNTTGVLNKANNFTYTIENLSVGNYSIVIRVDGIANFQRKYDIKITEPPALNAMTSVDVDASSLNLKLEGSSNYTINLNGRITQWEASKISLPLNKGLNTLRVSTDKDCQGVYNEEIFLSEETLVFPNPSFGRTQLYVYGQDQKVDVKITSVTGVQVYAELFEIPFNRLVDLDLSHLPTGTYLVSMCGDTVRSTKKFIKY